MLYIVVITMATVTLLISVTILCTLREPRLEDMINSDSKKLPEHEYDKYIHYRLSDMVKGYELDGYKSKQYHIETFPDSIIDQYFSQTDRNNDFAVLKKILSEYKNKSLQPSDDDIVLHVRIGDVLDKLTVDNTRYGHVGSKQGLSVNDFLYDENYSTYVKTLQYYIKELKKYPNLHQLVIVAGGNQCRYRQLVNSKQYLQQLTTELVNLGYKVSLHLYHHPDDDFVYMVRAKNFISGGGGFSTLIRQCKNGI
jgi:hypothetical protein